MSSRPSTIKDVAARAGVSTTTVSRYLNGARVRQAAAIKSAVSELAFHPSHLARSLKSGSTRTVGVMVPDISNPFFADVVNGIESVTRIGQYSLLLCNTDESAQRERDVTSLLLQKRVDGILMAPTTESSDAPLRFRARGIPVVFIDRTIEGGGFDAVLVESASGAGQAAEYLVSLGHERIAVISGPLDTTPGRERHEGFVAGLRARGRTLDPQYEQLADFRSEGGYQAALRLLAVAPPPTAVFVANNLMAIGALRAIHDLGVRLPDELSFVSFDDLALAGLMNPAITVVNRPTAEQGILAMRMLQHRMASVEAIAPRTITLETRLLVRESCRAVPTRTPQPARVGSRG